MTSTVPKVINAPKCTENYICDGVLINLYRMLKHVITLLLLFFFWWYEICFHGNTLGIFK